MVMLVKAMKVLSTPVAMVMIRLIALRSLLCKWTVTIGSFPCVVLPPLSLYDAPDPSKESRNVIMEAYKEVTFTVSENQRVNVSLDKSRSNLLRTGLTRSSV